MSNKPGRFHLVEEENCVEIGLEIEKLFTTERTIGVCELRPTATVRLGVKFSRTLVRHFS